MMGRRKERQMEKEAAEAGVASLDCPFEADLEAMPVRTARGLVISSALQSVRKFLGDHGAEDVTHDLTLGQVFERARKDDAQVWWVEGRPLNRTQVQNLLVNLVAEGELLPALCKVDGMPSLLTVVRWQEDFPDFAAWMHRAERAQAALFMAETLDIADGATPNTSFVAKLRMDQRSKVAGFLDSKRFGAKSSVDVTIHQDVEEQHVRGRLEAMLLTNADHYREMFGILLIRVDELPALVLKEAERLRDAGIEVLKTAGYSDDMTIDADFFRVNKRTERE